MAKKNTKIDLSENGIEVGLLFDLKEIERRKIKKLKKVPILNGYVLTDNPEKWDEFKK